MKRRFEVYRKPPLAPPEMFACVACQRPVTWVFDRLCGIKTLLCMCETCGEATKRRFGDGEG